MQITLKKKIYHESDTIFGSEATIWQRVRPNTDCNPLVVCCVKNCVLCVVRCISDLQFNNERKVRKYIFRIFSVSSSLGASRDYSARRNGSILILECAGSTRSAGLVEYGTVLACHNCSTYERLMLNTVQF